MMLRLQQGFWAAFTMVMLVAGVAGAAQVANGEPTPAPASATACVQPADGAERQARREYRSCRTAERAAATAAKERKRLARRAERQARLEPTLPPLPVPLPTGTPTPEPTPTPTPTPAPTPTPPPSAAGQKLIGMSAPAAMWAQRVSEVGADGLKARRIFGDLTADGRSQANLIEQAHDAGLVPVVSYKLPSVSQAINGAYDSWAEATAAYLASFGRTTAVTIWHEPHGDMTPAEFRAIHARLGPFFDRGQLQFGPVLNGWLLDRRRADFESYMSPELVRGVWDFVGIDSYQSGTAESPGPVLPGDRIDPLLDVVADLGSPDEPLLVGEYNGYSGAALRESGEKFLATPTLWIACVWNSDGGKGAALSGERLDAFRETKADRRAAR